MLSCKRISFRRFILLTTFQLNLIHRPYTVCARTCLLFIWHVTIVPYGLSLYYHSKHLQSTGIIFPFSKSLIRFVTSKHICFKNALNYTLVFDRPGSWKFEAFNLLETLFFLATGKSFEFARRIFIQCLPKEFDSLQPHVFEYLSGKHGEKFRFN